MNKNFQCWINFAKISTHVINQSKYQNLLRMLVCQVSGECYLPDSVSLFCSVLFGSVEIGFNFEQLNSGLV
jgi:hypothetical protein